LVKGKIRGADRENDPLTYAIASGPRRGKVVVDADGTYTYTPNATLAATGGTDTFYVRIGEANDSSHISGPIGGLTRLIRIFSLGLINLEGTLVRVKVTVPATAIPAITALSDSQNSGAYSDTPGITAR
jgi:hypothetical protein